MTRVGWVVDRVEYVGGQELSMDELVKASPYEIVPIFTSPGAPIVDVDVFVVGNCVNYSADVLLPQLVTAPVIKRMADWWEFGDPDLRQWLLTYSQLFLFSSLSHMKDFPWAISDAIPSYVIPPPLDLKRFRQARAASDPLLRRGTCWIGHMHDPIRKGISETLNWAVANDEVIDFYGDGIPSLLYEHSHARVHPVVPYEEVPQVMAQYERFIFLPRFKEAFARSVAEAYSAGCTVVTNAVPGCVDYILNGSLRACDYAAEVFWKTVTQVVGEKVTV